MSSLEPNPRTKYTVVIYYPNKRKVKVACTTIEETERYSKNKNFMAVEVKGVLTDYYEAFVCGKRLSRADNIKNYI